MRGQRSSYIALRNCVGVPYSLLLGSLERWVLVICAYSGTPDPTIEVRNCSENVSA